MKLGEVTLRHILTDLAEALDHPATTEVVVQQPGKFGVEQDGFWSWHDAPSLTYDRLEAIAILSARMGGKDVGGANPSCSSTLPDGQRIKMVLPPAVPEGTISLSIRRRALSFVPTLAWLEQQGYFSALDPSIDWPAYFQREAIDKRQTTLVGGDIGSSKTTFAEALLRTIPLAARLVTVERSPEWLNLPHPNWVSLFFDDADPANATKRVQDAMQMRPDWLPFQELQGAEAHAMLRALKIGTPGITTIHAPGAKHVFGSLASMIQQSDAGRGQAADDIKADLRNYVRLIVHCVRVLPRNAGERTRYRLSEVVEVGLTEAEDRTVSAATPDALP